MLTKENLHSRPELAAYIAARDCVKIAEIVSAGRTRLEKRLIGEGTVLDALGPDAGAALLDAMEAASAQVPAIKYGLALLKKADLDISLPSVRGQFDKLVLAGMLTQADADNIKALAEVPDPVSARTVAETLYNDDGSMK